MCDACAASCELNISALHAVKLVALITFCTFLDHTISVCEFSAKDVAEDLCVSVGMCWEAVGGCDTVFIENTERAKVLELRVVVVGEGEGMVGVEPAVVTVTTSG